MPAALLRRRVLPCIAVCFCPMFILYIANRLGVECWPERNELGLWRSKLPVKTSHGACISAHGDQACTSSHACKASQNLRSIALRMSCWGTERILWFTCMIVNMHVHTNASIVHDQGA
jgi:hypothetical protein